MFHVYAYQIKWLNCMSNKNPDDGEQFEKWKKKDV